MKRMHVGHEKKIMGCRDEDKTKGYEVGMRSDEMKWNEEQRKG